MPTPVLLRHRLAPVIALAALIVGAPHGVTAQRAAPSLDQAARRDVVDTVGAHLARFYVDADTGRQIGRHLAERLRAGAYDSLAEPERFADALTRDLRAVNGDRHLAVFFAPDDPGERPGPEGLATPGFEPDTAAPPPSETAAARRDHFGFGRLDVLPGNVGYVEVRGFADGPEAKAIATSALAYLASTDAVIFDLRHMPGGSGDMSNFILSHFTGPDSVESLRIFNRSAGRSVSRWTLGSVPGPRRTDVPVYVLVGRGTASAGEDFAFVLHNLGRATLVGDRTAGAGHNNAFLDAGHGFSVSVSFTRVADPRTGLEWERVGVQPDVRCDTAAALAVAHAHALRHLAGAAVTADERRTLGLTAEYVEGRQRNLRVAAGRLARLTGRYGSDRVVRLEGPRLVYVRAPGYPPLELLPLSDTTFAATPVVRLTFERPGTRDARLRVLGSDGAVATYPRIGPPLPPGKPPG